jgi:hypothetical protein
VKLQWTATGLLAATLGDDAAKFVVAIEQIGGQSVDQSEQLAGGPNLALFPRGNVGGSIVFRSTKTYATVAATFAQFKTEYARLNQQGVLDLIEGGTTLHFPNAVLKGVQRIFGSDSGGARMGIRYTFDITTIT